MALIVQNFPYKSIEYWCQIADTWKEPSGVIVRSKLREFCRCQGNHSSQVASLQCKELAEFGFIDALNHIAYLSSNIEICISPDMICDLHNLVCVDSPQYGPGQYRKGIVAINGGRKTFGSPADIPVQLYALCKGFHHSLRENHPIVAAALLHRDFVSIHPFINGNGRVARLLMNLILLHYGYKTLFIQSSWREEYCDALASDIDGNTTGRFPLLISKMVALNQLKMEDLYE